MILLTRLVQVPILHQQQTIYCQRKRNVLLFHRCCYHSDFSTRSCGSIHSKRQLQKVVKGSNAETYRAIVTICNDNSHKFSGRYISSSNIVSNKEKGKQPIQQQQNNSKENDEPFILNTNISLIGLPGSGKGFYGRLLSSAWNNVPLYSTSTILREYFLSRSNMNMTTTMDNDTNADTNATIALSNDAVANKMSNGQLIDCETVSTIVNEYLVKKHSDTDMNQQQQPKPYQSQGSGFIMDGYPRTLRQIELMEQTWNINDTTTTSTTTDKKNVIIPIAFHINVPVEVCVAKILGRKKCRLCNKEPNDANVQIHVNSYEYKFNLPPTRPIQDCIHYNCNPIIDWYTRDDDTTIDIIHERLHVHQQNEQPILDYYKENGKLIQFTPYNGQDDFPQLLQHIEQQINCIIMSS